MSEPSSIDAVRQLKADYIFHLAAIPYAPYTTLHPREAYVSNVVTTVNMLEAARLSRVQKFIFASSACVFGAAQHSPLRITDQRYRPEHYYSITKQAAEKEVHAFHQWHGVEATICRFGNVYGPGDRHFGRIVPQICNQLITEKRETLELKRSTGDSIFEFTYVDDAVKAFLMATENVSSEVETFQFSGGENSRTSVRALAEAISETFDGKRRVVKTNEHNPEKKVEKYLDTAMTRRVLGWESDYDLADGLKLTVDWYNTHINSIVPLPQS